MTLENPVACQENIFYRFGLPVNNFLQQFI